MAITYAMMMVVDMNIIYIFIILYKLNPIIIMQREMPFYMYKLVIIFNHLYKTQLLSFYMYIQDAYFECFIIPLTYIERALGS